MFVRCFLFQISSGAAMTRFFAYPVICLTAISLSALLAGSVAADDLFSTIPLDKVFSKPTNGNQDEPKPTEKTEKAVRVLNQSQLNDLLRDAGLEPEAGETVANLKFVQTRFTFNVAVGLDETRQQILILLRLADLEGKPALTADRLLTMLTINRDLRPVMFAYSEKNKRLELLRGLDNDQISPRMLREEIKRLAGIAEGTSSVWEVSAAPTTPAAPAPTATAAAPTARTAGPVTQQTAPPAAAQAAPAAPAANLVGKWSASRTAKEAFAMQLNADSTFVLVYVKDGKQSKSVGKFTTASGQLTLTTTDGGKFAGNVSNLTAKSFDFTPPTNAAGKLTFQKAG